VIEERRELEVITATPFSGSCVEGSYGPDACRRAAVVMFPGEGRWRWYCAEHGWPELARRVVKAVLDATRFLSWRERHGQEYHTRETLMRASGDRGGS
jgi:hypothetical protein